MSGCNKEVIFAVLERLGFRFHNKTCTISTVANKGVSLVLAILFTVLCCKAKANGKIGKKRVFTVLAVLFYINTVLSCLKFIVINADDDEAVADEEDFQ
jgi:heme/copper-type cytochrome/quinol oxidase subunit 4